MDENKEAQEGQAAPVAPALTVVNTPAPAVLRVDLSKHVRKVEPIWVAFRDIKLKIAYISKGILNQISQSSLDHVWNEKTKTRVPQVNAERFTREFCKTAVLDWANVTPRTLSGLIPLDLEAMGTKEETMDSPIEFSQTNVVSLFRNCYDLDEFIQNSCMDLALFNREKTEQEMGN